MVSVNDPRHEELMADVDVYIQELGGTRVQYGVEHIIKDPGILDQLRKMETTTAHHIRSRRDSIGIFPEQSKCIYIDAKTNPGQYPNHAIELPPFRDACEKFAKGVDVIFVCRAYPGKSWQQQFDFGLIDLESARLAVDRLMIPAWRHDDGRVKEIYKVNKDFLNRGREYPVRVSGQSRTRRGSGDPYVLLPYSYIKELPHWKKCFERWLHGGGMEDQRNKKQESHTQDAW